MRPTKTRLFHLNQAVSVCAALAVLSVSAAGSKMKAGLPWDWTGIIGTGQSLSVGAQGCH
ncbi:MAG: hypothetical protein WBN75_17980 [Verrucomicrobiia bacterium]|jgi:hypothetical protein